jgi:hypothetical protein
MPVNVISDNAERLPRQRTSLTRQRSEDVCDEMRMFDAGGTHEQPPTRRVTGRVKQTNAASLESNIPVRGIVGRARGESFAEDESACSLAMSSSAGAAPDELEAARAGGAGLSA